MIPLESKKENKMIDLSTGEQFLISCHDDVWQLFTIKKIILDDTSIMYEINGSIPRGLTTDGFGRCSRVNLANWLYGTGASIQGVVHKIDDPYHDHENNIFRLKTGERILL